MAPRRQELAERCEPAAEGDAVEAPTLEAVSPEPRAIEPADDPLEALLLGLEPTSRRARRRRRA